MLNTILKWAATATLIAGSLVNSLGYYPAGPIMLLIGGLLWLIVSVRWQEPALIATNSVMFFAGAGGLIYTYFK